MTVQRLVSISLALIMVVVLAIPAAAHSPVFPEDNHSPDTAFAINNPTKSWVYYASLDHPDKADYYRFQVSKGERILVSLMTAKNPADSDFLPSFVLMTPGAMAMFSLPDYVEVPQAYGIQIIEGTVPDKAGYEPFSPGIIYEVGNLDISAPADGTYYIAVYDNSQKTGNYSLAVGFVESFTPAEFLLIPIDIHTTYAWEGQNYWVTWLPYILTLLVGGLLIFLLRRGKSPRTLSQRLSAFAGLAFLGTSISLLYQMVRTITVTGFATEAVITLIIILLGVVLGYFALRYALLADTLLTAGRRVILIIIGVAALIVWSGVFLGTILVIVSALLPQPALPLSLQLNTND